MSTADYSLRLIRPTSFVPSSVGFGSVNYDGGVPGIASSSFSGPVGAPTSRTPAGIAYAAETSYYAGAGFEAHF